MEYYGIGHRPRNKEWSQRRRLPRPHQVGDTVKRADGVDYLTVHKDTWYIVTETRLNRRSYPMIKIRRNGRSGGEVGLWFCAENFTLVEANKEIPTVAQSVQPEAIYILTDEKGQIIGSISAPMLADSETAEDRLDNQVQRILRKDPDTEILVYSLEKRAKLPPIKVEYTYEQPSLFLHPEVQADCSPVEEVQPARDFAAQQREKAVDILSASAAMVQKPYKEWEDPRSFEN